LIKGEMPKKDWINILVDGVEIRAT
jgi:hypothetical protein